MKKFVITMGIMLAALSMSGREAIARTGFSDNWGVGVDAGLVSPLKGHSFFGNMRPTAGVSLEKRVLPSFSLGTEAVFGFNTSRLPGAVHSSTAFDNSYLGVYGSVDFLSLSGSACAVRPVAFGISAGCGWGHDFHSGILSGHSYFATKAGVFVRFNITRQLALSLAPSVMWDMSDARTSGSSASYSRRHGAFMLQAGLRYNFGPGFDCPPLYDPAKIDNLNGQINTLRAECDRASEAAAAADARAERLAAELAELKARKPEIVKEEAVNNRLNTVLDVFFLLGSSKITADQLPNVERIAAYLKNHSKAHVVIKGYASRDGNRESNLILAEKRALAVKNELIKRYGIAPARITASGAGIGDFFEEDSWNRVSVCTLEN